MVMSELQELQEINKQLTTFAATIKRVEVVLIGDEFNHNGVVPTQEAMKAEIKEIKEYIIQQKTGWNLGKWIVGSSLGAFLLSQIGELQHFIRQIFK